MKIIFFDPDTPSHPKKKKKKERRRKEEERKKKKKKKEKGGEEEGEEERRRRRRKRSSLHIKGVLVKLKALEHECPFVDRFHCENYCYTLILPRAPQVKISMARVQIWRT
jgi:hypothetical protein